MQFLVEVTFWSGIITSIIALVGGGYLLNVWRKQPSRLWTDLPLVFGFVFIVTSINIFMLSTMNAGILPDTLEVFKIRSLVIGGAVLPFLATIMHIWLAKYRKYFKYVLALSVGYWIIVNIFATSSSMIMIMVMPLLLSVMIGMILTFSVTYRTGRLKEVRSGLILISMVLTTLSQVTRVSLMAMGLGFIGDILTTLGIFVLVIGVANPWKSISKKTEPEPVPEIYA